MDGTRAAVGAFHRSPLKSPIRGPATALQRIGWNISPGVGIIDVMRRSVWFRSLATFLAFWFPLIAGEPGVVRICPTHGAGDVTRAAVAHATSADMHSHMHHAASQAGDNQQQAPSHNHHDCTCIGCCCTANGAVRAPDVASIELAVVEYGVARSVPSVESLARPAPEFSRPYTTGPPRV